MKYLLSILFFIIQACCLADNLDDWKIEPIASEKILWTSPNPSSVYLMTPGIAVLLYVPMED